MSFRNALIQGLVLLTVALSPLAAAEEASDIRTMQMLKQKEFKRLDAEVNALIKAYSLDYTRERELDLALDTFFRMDPDLEPFFSGWTSAFPRSPAAHLAKGIYWSGMAWKKRGTKYLSDSTKEQIDGMQYYFEKAYSEFEAAKSIDPKLVHALCYQMEILMNFGRQEQILKLKDQALTINPYSLTARWYYISSILPRWGGSVAQIQREVDLAKPYYDKNPSLKILDGRVIAEMGDQSFFSGNFTQAIQFYSIALKSGDHWYYNKQRGEAYYYLQESEQSNKDIDIAIALRPNYPRAYFIRGVNYYRLGKYDRAIDDFSMMFTSDLSQAMAWDLRGNAYLKSGQTAKALSDFRAAVGLDPNNAEYLSDIKKAEQMLGNKNGK